MTRRGKPWVTSTLKIWEKDKPTTYTYTYPFPWTPDPLRYPIFVIPGTPKFTKDKEESIIHGGRINNTRWRGYSLHKLVIVLSFVS